MNKTSSASDYRFDAAKPHTNAYLAAPILSHLRRIGAQRVLDLGCGNGAMARDLVEAGMAVVGIDPSESGIEHCRKAVPGATFHCMGIYDDPSAIAEADFDAVVSTEVVEHLFYPRELPAFAHAKLKSSGHFLVTTPYHGFLKNLALAVTNKWDAHHDPLWDGGHIKFWSRPSLTRLLEEGGFAVESFEGCGRLPYLWKSMLLVARKRQR